MSQFSSSYHIPLTQIGEQFPDLQLPPDLLQRGSHLKLFIDKSVTGSGYATVIAYEPPSLWYRKKFGQKVVAPVCLGIGAAFAVSMPLLDRRRHNDARRGLVVTTRPGPFYWWAAALAACAWLFGIYKRWLCSYSADFPSRLKRARREISLSIAQGGAATNRAIARHMAGGGQRAALTDLLVPAEWAELLLAYVAKADRIGDGSLLADVGEAFRCGAVSAPRRAAYLGVAAQSRSIRADLGAHERGLEEALARECAPYAKIRDDRVARAREDYEGSAAVVALAAAQRDYEEGLERVRRAEAQQREQEELGHRIRLQAGQVADAEQIHALTLANIGKSAEVEAKSLELRWAWSRQKYTPAKEHAEARMGVEVEAAAQAYRSETLQFQQHYEHSVATARKSAEALQQALSRRLVAEEKPKCDAEDLQSRFSPPAESIHSSVPMSLHRPLRDFLGELTAGLNSSQRIAEPAIIDSMRVYLSVD